MNSNNADKWLSSYDVDLILSFSFGPPQTYFIDRVLVKTTSAYLTGSDAARRFKIVTAKFSRHRIVRRRVCQPRCPADDRLACRGQMFSLHPLQRRQRSWEGNAAEAADRLSRYRGLERGRQFERCRRHSWASDAGAPSNAAKVFINWFLSREGQTALQKFGRPDAHNSRRIDISKMEVDAFNRLEDGKNISILPSRNTKTCRPF